MAETHPLEILKQGVEAWNTWRGTHKHQTIDLSNQNLSTWDLRGANLSGVNLRFSELIETDLTSANLKDADLRFSSLLSATLPQATLRSANLRDANLNDVDLSCTDLRFANLSSADLISANLVAANLNSANLILSDLRFADLSSADLSSADLSATNLSSANLRGATLLETKLHGADLNQAVLTGACIQDWSIDAETKLEALLCDFVYLKLAWDPDQQEVVFRERLPEQADQCLTRGDLVQWIRRTNMITVNMVFEEINWQAFHQAFTQVRSVYGHDLIMIQGIDTSEEGALVIRINAPLGDIQTQLRSTYDQVLSSQPQLTPETQSTSYTQMEWIVEVLAQYRHQQDHPS